MMTIFPDLSISIRAICTPAALTALTALVTSCCRNVDGARAMASYRGMAVPIREAPTEDIRVVGPISLPSAPLGGDRDSLSDLSELSGDGAPAKSGRVR